MEQSKLESLIEAIANTLIGFAISFLAWPIAAWIFNMPYNPGQHFGIVIFFTVLSVVRGYAVRRWFNYRLKMAAIKLAARFYKGEQSANT